VALPASGLIARFEQLFSSLISVWVRFFFVPQPLPLPRAANTTGPLLRPTWPQPRQGRRQPWHTRSRRPRRNKRWAHSKSCTAAILAHSCMADDAGAVAGPGSDAGPDAGPGADAGAGPGTIKLPEWPPALHDRRGASWRWTWRANGCQHSHRPTARCRVPTCVCPPHAFFTT
jgi:hypothetical protein